MIAKQFSCNDKPDENFQMYVKIDLNAYLYWLGFFTGKNFSENKRLVNYRFSNGKVKDSNAQPNNSNLQTN